MAGIIGGNRALPRSQVTQLVLDLGHDPKRVAEVHIAPDEVHVVYVHRITDGLEED